MKTCALDGIDVAYEEYGDIMIQRASFLGPLKEFMNRYIRPALARSDAVFCDEIRQDAERYGLSFDVDDLPQPFKGPSLFLAGRQDTAVGYRDAWRIIESYPRASFVVLDRAEHGTTPEQDALFKALVHEWLDRVEEAETHRPSEKRLEKWL